ncbi:hypothetical protein AVV30_gp017 [Vibrio phage phi 1]|uniref:Uncharacterized protein n=1 Tax=Vibrio phage phi 1 TaxID=1589297 RepID=A0A0B5HDW1_9CAUD|nr:hypothetical protein AVV30_gp017 [Vibrio phage phi 1]AJF40675.1 hypothetical protein SBVP1_0017 [Vibrio phage phi 1]
MQLHKTYYDSAEYVPDSIWFKFKNSTWIYRTYRQTFNPCLQDYLDPNHELHHDMKPIPLNWIIGTQGQTTN